MRYARSSGACGPITRYSLLLRLLLLSLTVALGAVAATAVLATYSTGEQLEGEIQKADGLVETDTLIYSSMLNYAGAHDSWAGVEDTVVELARQTGRRIALTDQDGRIIVDSARLLGEGSPPLPSLAAASVDWAAPPSQPEAEFVKKAAGTAVVSGGVSLSGGYAVSPYWRMSKAEIAERSVLAKRALTCLAEHDIDAIPITGPEGVPQILLPTQAAEKIEPLTGKTSMVATKQPAMQHPCIPAKLSAPSKVAQKVDASKFALTKACLDGNGFEYVEVDGQDGTRSLAPKDAGTVGGSGEFGGFDTPDDVGAAVPADAAKRALADCDSKARTEALRPYVAPAAKLYLGTSDRFNAFSGDGLWRTAATALIVLLIAAAITVLAGRRMVQPIHALTGAAQRMTAGDRTARVSAGGKDEVGRLARAFNTMAETIERNEQQRKAMVSDIAHELRTPLSNVRGYLEAAEDGVVPLDRALVRSLLEDAGLLERLVGDLQQLALADAGMLHLHPEECDVSDLARQVVAAYCGSAERLGVDLELSAAEPVTVQGDPGRLRQALGNLVDNALSYTGEGGRVEVSVRRSGGFVECAVADTGPGIAAEHLPHLFERFYRADPSRSRATGGSGLGLAITKHLVEAHSGAVEVKSTVGKGSVFTIHLPLS
jgi:two-component system sensor histidine kinase BaeS